MRIAINAMTLGPRDTGVGVWTRGLIRSLGAADPENDYLIYHGEDATELPSLPGNARYVRIRFHNRRRALRILWEQLVLPRRLRRDRVDVLHCPAYLLPLRCETPTVLTLHDLFALSHPSFCTPLNAHHYRLALPASIRRATVVHCTSHWTRKRLLERFPGARERAHVIHPGIDGIFRPQPTAATARFMEEHGLSEAPWLSAGRPEPKKNLDLLLEALAALKGRRQLRRKLVMVGGRHWWGHDVMARVRLLGLAEDVVHLGYVARAQMPVIYAAAFALVFPSRAEGFGLPPLEAMACGTAVLSSGKAGLAESAAEAALRVSVDDPADLAQKMHTLESIPSLREEMRRAGLQRAAAFRWSDAARRFLELYYAAVGSG